MADHGVQAVLTGNCGPNAYQTLSAAGIAVMIGCSGTVADAVEQFNAGQLNAAGEPNVAGKSGLAGAPSPFQYPPPQPQQGRASGPGMGMGRGGGGGMGMGRGRGGGRGMGRGMGRGRGMGMGAGSAQGPVPIAQQPPGNLTKDDELAMLRQQAEAMSRQMQQIQERIEQIRKQYKAAQKDEKQKKKLQKEMEEFKCYLLSLGTTESINALLDAIAKADKELSWEERKEVDEFLKELRSI